MQELKKQKLENEKDTELLVSRWLQQAGREATHARVTDRRPKVGQDYDDAMYSPLKGIGDTLDTMVMCGASPTTVQVDQGLLVHSQCVGMIYLRMLRSDGF